MKQTTKSFLWLLAAIAAVFALAARIYCAQSQIIDTAVNGESIVLNEDTSPSAFASLLMSKGYISDEKEARFVAANIINSIREHGGNLKSIGELADKDYGLLLDDKGLEAISAFPALRYRAERLQGVLEDMTPVNPHPEAGLAKKYSVSIREGSKWSRIVSDTCYLHVREHWYETVEEDGKIIKCDEKDSLYALMPVCGKARIWLPDKDGDGNQRYFTIVPVQKGFTFGRARSTYKSRSFNFVRKDAVLPLLSRNQLKAAREDNSILVRTAEEYKDTFVSTFFIFAALWLLAFLILAAVDSRKRVGSSLELLALAALLTGMGLVNLFNVQHPLWGKLYAWPQLIKGILPGIAALVICAYIDWQNIYIYSHTLHLSKGKGYRQGLWMVAGAFLIAILLLLGSGPGGTHVNLPLIGVQGSPIIKVLTLGFLSVFFAGNSDLIESYTAHGKTWKNIMVLSIAILALLVLGIGQLAISDLGPYLVIVITAVLLFSLASGETVPMLIGTAIFVAALLIGTRFLSGRWLPYAIFALWAAGWVAYSVYKKQGNAIHAIAFSLVILLAFHGGTLFEIVGARETADRLNGRTVMASNIFDNEVPGGSQIAEGIWAVTRGGAFGMPEAGLSATIPAAHTDLAGITLTENTGMFGFMALLVLLGLLIFIELRIGMRNGHPFAFALCSLIAFSLGIQSLLIICGSTGVIPLTGVPLPFISYGGASLVVELACIGIVISLSRKKDVKLEALNTRKYEKMFQAQFGAYIVLAVVAIMTVVNYAFVSRDKYMVKFGKFINNEGTRILMKNPLIDKIKKDLLYGDILDRKGKVLATTDAAGMRIYPYGNYTFFITGDSKTKTLWGTAGKRSAGLLGEERFQPALQGYETMPTSISLVSKMHYSTWLPNLSVSIEEHKLEEDYSALIPLMKNPGKIRQWNENKHSRDITLTIDAELQKALEEALKQFILDEMSGGKVTDRTRISVVAIDARDGSLLISAMYPLPDQKILRDRAFAGETVYRDWAHGFKAFSDMDLGLIPLAPGSTVKILTAGAGLRIYSTALDSTEHNQFVYKDEIIDRTLGEPTGNVSLKKAIVESSNIYFIKLLNRDGRLYPELSEILYSVGGNFGNAKSYVLYPEANITSEEAYARIVTEFGDKATKKYSDYVASEERHKLNDAEYQPAWGQGAVTLSPIALCRYVAAVANDGRMMYPRYTASDTTYVYKQLLSPEEAHVLQNCMKAQAAGRFGSLDGHIYGKTGTPSRADRASRKGQTNDALYCFFVDGDATTSSHPIAVTVRMERVNDYSRIAMRLTNDVVLPTLRKNNYIK